MAIELDTLLSRWTDRRGVELDEIDDEGRHHFVFDGEHEVACFQAGERIFLQSGLRALPTQRDNAAALVDSFLKLQLARAHRSPEIMTIDKDNGQLVLFRQLDANAIETADFDDAISSFVNAVAFWSKQNVSGPVARSPFAAPASQFVYP